MADAFEQELLADIAEAEAIGEHDLAAEWRWQLNTYRAAKKQAILEEQAWAGSSALARRQTLGKRRSDQPCVTYLRHYLPPTGHTCPSHRDPRVLQSVCAG